MPKRPFWSLIKRGLSILLFLLLLLVVNIINSMFQSALFDSATRFLNTNAVLLISVSIIFLLGDLFLSFRMPLNLPAPIFFAIGSMLLVTFVFRLFSFIDQILGMSLFSWLQWMRWILYWLVPLIVLIVGYLSLLGPKKHRRRRR